MEFRVELTGQKKFQETLKSLPRSMRTKVYYRSLLAGGGVVRDAASDNVKRIVSDEASGVLAANIRVYRMKKKRGWYRVAIRVRKGAVNSRKKDGQGNPVRVGLYGSVLEYGKENQPPRSWIRKAIRDEKVSAQIRVASEVRKLLPQALEDAKK
jgi:HK97 gp10 family phage protein